MAVKTKFDENQEYFSSNWRQLKEMFPGYYVSVLNKEVVYVARDNDTEFQMWNSLNSVEQLEVYTRYIPRKNEIFVV